MITSGAGPANATALAEAVTDGAADATKEGADAGAEDAACKGAPSPDGFPHPAITIQPTKIAPRMPQETYHKSSPALPPPPCPEPAGTSPPAPSPPGGEGVKSAGD